jgi:predicted RNA polymerase sigma factor
VTGVADAVADAHRREWAAVLAVTVRVTGDLDLAEECVQDAYAAALDTWGRTGVPDRPGGWLTVAARHNALDALRRATRTDPDGRLVRLAEQDRSAWDRSAVAEADGLVVGALRAGPAGRFTLQAAIAALHASAPTYADTDWPQILLVYDALLRVWPSPVVALNRAVAVAEVDGPAAALTAVDAVSDDPRLAGYRYLPAVRADLLRRLGREAESAAAYRQAIALTDNDVERAFLADQLADPTVEGG